MFIPLIPLSGVGGWRLLQQTEASQRAAHDRSNEIAREVDYFKEKIGTVRSSDELLADRRLLEVALTAYGLEDEIDKRALIKRVLDGGVTNSDSFANRLNDTRWRDFAGAFGFGDPGSGTETSAFEAAIALQFRGAAPLASAALDPLALQAARTTLAAVASVDDLLAAPETLDIALQAFGLERGYYNDDHFRALLSDGGAYAATLEDPKWASFAGAFTGLGDGQPIPTVSQFQLDTVREIVRRDVTFDEQAVADASASKISADDLDYFRGTVETVLSGADLISDPRTLKVAKVAFGLAETTLSDQDIADLVDAAIAGDLSLAEARPEFGWSQLATSIAATVNGGSAARIRQFEYVVEIGIGERDLEFVPGLDPEPERPPSVAAEDLAYFLEAADEIATADDLLADDRALTVALTAFGLENSGRSEDFIRSVLEEDPRDPAAFVNQLSDTRWADFAKAFRPDPAVDGSAALWRLELEDRLIANGAPDEDLDYLRRNFNLIESNLDFVLDPKLMDITMSAFGIEKGRYGSNFFVSAVISDPANPRSFVNLLDDPRFTEMVGVLGSFAGRGGNTALESFQNTVVDRFKSKAFARAVGEQDGSMRLALNFRDQIDTIANGRSVATAGWLQLMGDAPLREVLDGALGLPSQFAQLDIDSQVAVYESRASRLFGGADPSVFRDPANVRKVIDLYLVGEAAAQTPGFSTPGYGALSLIQQTASFARGLNAAF